MGRCRGVGVCAETSAPTTAAAIVIDSPVKADRSSVIMAKQTPAQSRASPNQRAAGASDSRLTVGMPT
jgi:hypothetical protein